jgi:hypothetical protein
MAGEKSLPYLISLNRTKNNFYTAIGVFARTVVVIKKYFWVQLYK